LKKKLLYSFIAILAGIIGYLALPSNLYLRRALYYHKVSLDDYKIFTKRVVKTGTYQPWKVSENVSKKTIPAKYQADFTNLGTVAFLVIKDSTVMFEEYWDNYNADSYSNSFSVAKSIVSLLVGCAIDDGYIKSIDQPVGDFLPEYKAGTDSTLTLRHLLTMSSGLNWDESYNSPFSITTKAYFGADLKTLVLNLKVAEKPGIRFKYLSCNTQLISLVIEKATGKKLSEYASQRLWIPMGARHDVLWSLDNDNGVEKAYCCFNSNARDFARIGQLILNKGMCNGKQLISSSYIEQATSPASWLLSEDGSKPLDNYGYQWWLTKYKNDKVIYARGILGQYIFIIPAKNMVIVRLGHKRNPVKVNGLPADVFTWLGMAYEVVER
jgi:CubicO group peptidase (beta-lactamase class C family)